MFFYAMNDWRSTFDGANDHEADLEQCFVVLEALADGAIEPAWFCAAAHDEKGDDLRRRWDDPRLEIDRRPPVVYPGAGSHATYLERGEYIMLLPFPGRAEHPRAARPRPADLARHPRTSPTRATSRQAPSGRSASRSSTTRAATGSSVGPGGDIEWTPILIGDDDGWVDGYRGLWGLDTGDRFAGERAPAGPKYTRTGTVRQSWHDPLGFAGLGKVAPPSQAIPRPRGPDRRDEAERAAIVADEAGARRVAARARARRSAASASAPGWTATGRGCSPSSTRARSA